MKKQTYMKPDMRVLMLQHQHQLLAGSVNNVEGGDSGIGFGGGGDGPARAPFFDGWEE